MIRIDLDESAPAFAKAMSHLDRAMVRVADEAGLAPALRELVRTRASQLNGCAYCVDMHTKDALAGGETDQRLYALPVWRETPFFTDQERAALEFTEVVTRLTDTHVPDEAYRDASKHFSEAEMGALISLIVTINAWNMIGVSTRAWEPGSYQP
jgi:AhpD family alkylhydroperoxidase